MKPREIFTVSVSADYSQEENGVNKRWKLCVAFCLTGKTVFLSDTRVLKAHSEATLKNQTWAKQEYIGDWLRKPDIVIIGIDWSIHRYIFQ